MNTGYNESGNQATYVAGGKIPMTDLNGKLNTAEPLLYSANCSLRTQIYTSMIYISIKIPVRLHYSGTYLMFFLYCFFFFFFFCLVLFMAVLLSI